MNLLDAYDSSLELVVESCGDPVPLVYARLFQSYPDMEKLFVLDTDGGARGNMLTQALTCGRDLIGDDSFATQFIAAERMNHEGYAINDDIFDGFFTTVHNVFRENAGAKWSRDMENVWMELRAKAKAARL